MKKDVVVSGIRPTGFIHLGNYFGAVRNWISMQHEFDCFFSIVDWHSFTTHPDTKNLKNDVHQLLAELLASGVDPDKCVLFIQSDVPEIAELYLYLNMMAYKGELEKTPTFKDKVRSQPDNVNAGLLTYPVLQAADILVHRAAKVPVGKDQEQHIEIARKLAERFHHRYGEVFPMPQSFNYGNELLKIMSLNGNGKMSKSENQMNTLYLADSDELLRKKIMKAKTDSGPQETNAQKPDYIANLFTLMSLVSSKQILEEFEKNFNSCIIRYGDMKKQLAEDMIKFIAPVREKANAFKSDKTFLSDVIHKGKEKARESASATMKEVRKAMGMNY